MTTRCGKPFYKPKKGKALSQDEMLDNFIRVMNAEECIEHHILPHELYVAYHFLNGKKFRLGIHGSLESAVIAVERVDMLLDLARQDFL